MFEHHNADIELYLYRKYYTEIERIVYIYIYLLIIYLDKQHTIVMVIHLHLVKLVDCQLI